MCQCNRKPLYGYDTTQRIIFHIIAEYHQLCNVDETAKLFIGEAFFVHSSAFCQHSSMIIRFLHLYKPKRLTVHKQSDVRAELILSVFTSKLSCKMECVVSYIIEVNQFHRRYGFLTIVKTTTKLIIVQLFVDVFQYLETFSLISGIQFLNYCSKIGNRIFVSPS